MNQAQKTILLYDLHKSVGSLLFTGHFSLAATRVSFKACKDARLREDQSPDNLRSFYSNSRV